uniref:Carcinoembryonic antigen-related cell adhesion molecule 6-like isoform X2 n=1 Tax=Geotrypetes seraphini TaxID=260995 RepID=A0A6P8SK95_GEOSA|nr:carcinoembryonic antigen-related cell adhesion molecule 6-like isoform X2 [Geotrypetes seraphini]
MEFKICSRALPFLIAFLGLWSWQVSAVSVVPIPKIAAVGENVLLSVDGVSGDIEGFNWYKGESINTNQMLRYNPFRTPPDTVFSPYEGRVRGFPNGSMEISGVNIKDNGSYIVQIQAKKQEVATVTITVYEKLSKPSITANLTHPVEYRDSVALTCGTSNAAQTVLWFKDSQTLSSDDRMSLSQENRTLTISNVSTNDSGSYRCEAINPVSRSTSDPYKLVVYYGPKNVKITPQGPITQPLHSQLTLNCVTESVPAPTYNWTLNGTIKSHEGNLVLTDITFHNRGNYTCEAYNPVTELSGSASVYVNVTGVTAGPDSDPGPNPIPPWVIVVIVIVILIVIALIAASVYYFLLRDKSKSNDISMKESNLNTRSDPHLQSSSRNPATTGEEVNYSEVSFKPVAPKPTQPKLKENPTEYAEIRRT